jgi:hypothetical protein
MSCESSDEYMERTNGGGPGNECQCDYCLLQDSDKCRSMRNKGMSTGNTHGDAAIAMMQRLCDMDRVSDARAWNEGVLNIIDEWLLMRDK